MMSQKSKLNVLITAPLEFMPDLRVELNEICYLTDAYGFSKSEILKLKDIFDIMVVNPGDIYRIDRRIINHFYRLSKIVTPSTGTNHIDTDYCECRGVDVIGLLSDRKYLDSISASSEHTFLLILSVLRKFPKPFQVVKEGKWRDVEDSIRGNELRDKTVGIVGCGRIGGNVKRYCECFGAKVHTFDIIPDRATTTLDTLLSESDIIVISVNLTKESAEMVDSEWFDKMKDGVYLVNTSRGEVINEEDFIKYLGNKKIKSAAVDVVTRETNIKDNILINYSKDHENLIITPHIAGLTIESQRKSMQFVIKKLKEIMKCSQK